MSGSELRVPVVQRCGDLFAERNGYLYALLGLVAVGRKLEAFVAHLAKDEADHAQSFDASDSEQRVFFALGLIALRRKFQSVVDGWLDRAPAAGSETDDTSAMLLRLLR